MSDNHITVVKETTKVIDITKPASAIINITTENTQIVEITDIKTIVEIKPELDPILIEIAATTISGGGGSSSSSGRLEIEREISENVSALKLVVSSGFDLAEISQPNTTYEDAQVLGLALESGVTGAKIKILTLGIISDPFFNFALNAPLFLGLNGTVTNVPPVFPSSLYSVQVGKYIGLNEIEINIERSIKLI